MLALATNRGVLKSEADVRRQESVGKPPGLGADRPLQLGPLDPPQMGNAYALVNQPGTALLAHAITAARVRCLFGGALRLSHAALARGLGMRKEILQGEGDLDRIAFALTLTGRRVYTEAAVLAFLTRRDMPPPRSEKPCPNPPKLRARPISDAGAADFRQKLAARRRASV